MPKINLDENASLHEPLEVTICGKAYKIKDLTEAEFDKMIEMKSVSEQFAFCAGINIAEAKALPIRKTIAAIRAISTEQVKPSFTLDQIKKKDLKPEPIK